MQHTYPPLPAPQRQQLLPNKHLKLVYQRQTACCSSLVPADTTRSKDVSVEGSRHPDFVHGVTAACMLGADSVSLKHGAPHSEHSAWQVGRWARCWALIGCMRCHPCTCSMSSKDHIKLKITLCVKHCSTGRCRCTPQSASGIKRAEAWQAAHTMR